MLFSGTFKWLAVTLASALPVSSRIRPAPWMISARS
jgi:hypothetical protein